MTTQMTNLVQEIAGRAVLVALLGALVAIFLCLAAYTGGAYGQ
jgi:hypothetical protein